MMTADELRELCTALRAKERFTDDPLVDRLEADVRAYRDVLAADPTPLPPAELAERLPLMGWMIYETSWDCVQRISTSFDRHATAPDDREQSGAELDRVRRIANCARGLPWPEFAPRALGALRALALAESKRDTEQGYDAAWMLHVESRNKNAEFRDGYGSGDASRSHRLRLEEVFVQLALAETGTACRTAERVIARWAEEFEDPERPDWSRSEQERWIQRVFRELTDGVAVGEIAIATVYRIRDELGFADKVDEHRLTQGTAFQNPGIMTARAASLLLALRPAMRSLGRNHPPEFESWELWEKATLDRFVRAYRAIEEDVPGKTEMDAGFQRQLVHVRLNLALLKPGFDLPSRRADNLPCLAINPLSDDAVEAMSAHLGGPSGKGRERALGAATMPLFIRSLVECRGSGPDDRGYQTWRIKWFSLDQYSNEEGRLDRVRWALDAAG
ncbi:hypothetical protein DMB66_06235 [Actinoplanes sp. ATCC 53533]|uniref:hypothetical protein n=1 Tax=Actinoplanes sp. ATCC 53533 TaxID=1288362 RepID=UPI000F7B2C32|nr:hypothetical protein [Actinoplanes sp. ATCC 53533]RSM72194.1 hypothetical protein DMB66_06235 [Actinoplanes sp. ATCC 53533]